MASLMTSLGLDRLSQEQQIALVGELVDALSEPAETALSEAQRRELSRRLALLDAGETNLHAWADVESRALAKLSTVSA